METNLPPASVCTLVTPVAAPGAPAVPLSPDQAVRVRKAERLLRMDEVEARTGLRKSSLYAKIKRGEFPAPVRLTARSVAFPESRVDAWIEAMIRRADSSASPAESA